MRAAIYLSIFALALTTTLLAWLPSQQVGAADVIKWQDIADAKAPIVPAVPKGVNKVVWRTDFSKALAEAKKTGRPLFVTLRCIPCKQCSDFDKDVLEGGKELSPLLKRFITVRLTTMADVDERVLPYREYQDMDVSWWGYFLSGNAAFYGVYGGMDIKGDSTRISPKGLAATLRRVLNHHYQPKRSEWKVDRDAPDLKKGKAQTPSTLKGYKSWTKTNAGKHYLKPKKKGEDCLHCHWVNDIVRQPAIDRKKFDKKKDFDVWPYPENIGMSIERDDGLKVKSLVKKGPAEKAGIKKGDQVYAVGSHLVFSEADFRAYLNKLPHDENEFTVRVLRKGKIVSAKLKVKANWRKTNLGWRKSVNEAQLGAHFGFSWPLVASANDRKRRGIGKDSMAVRPWIPNNARSKTLPAIKAGLKANDIITAVNGKSPNITQRAFGIYIRLNFEPGDKITYTVKDPKGKERKITFKAK